MAGKVSEKKNWLIRTQDFQILGPVSKTKILELLNSDSLRPMDEVCSGNGYWFFIKEKDLVEKYLLSSEKQGYNPITEAKDVLNIGNEKPPAQPVKNIKIQKINTPTGEEVLIPSQSDLEYPDMGQDQEEEDDDLDDLTLIGTLPSTKELEDHPRHQEAPPPVSSNNQLKVDKKQATSSEDKKKRVETSKTSSTLGGEKKAASVSKKVKVQSQAEPKVESHERPETKKMEIFSGISKKSDSYLFYIFIIIALILITTFLYRKRIINNFLVYEFKHIGIHDSYANSSADLIHQKKKFQSLMKLSLRMEKFQS